MAAVSENLDRILAIRRDFPRSAWMTDPSGAQLEPGLSLDDEHAVEIRFVVKCKSAEQQQDLLNKLKLTSDLS